MIAKQWIRPAVIAGLSACALGLALVGNSSRGSPPPVAVQDKAKPTKMYFGVRACSSRRRVRTRVSNA